MIEAANRLQKSVKLGLENSLQAAEYEVPFRRREDEEGEVSRNEKFRERVAIDASEDGDLAHDRVGVGMNERDDVSARLVCRFARDFFDRSLSQKVQARARGVLRDVDIMATSAKPPQHLQRVETEEKCLRPSDLPVNDICITASVTIWHETRVAWVTASSRVPKHTREHGEPIDEFDLLESAGGNHARVVAAIQQPQFARGLCCCDHVR